MPAYKNDQSPVTEADEQAEKIILDGLARHFPDIPVVAEEQASAGQRARTELGNCFFLVDPLDGTKEFVAGREDFTVNIALIENGVPVAGIVYAPARAVLYAGALQSAYRASVAAVQMRRAPHPAQAGKEPEARAVSLPRATI